MLRSTYHRLVSFSKAHRLLAAAFLVCFLCVVFIAYSLFAMPPAAFPSHKIFSLEEGTTVSAIATSLEEQNLIRSPFVFKTLISVFWKDKVLAGDYFFAEPVSIFSIASRISHGKFGLTPLRITVFEGYSNTQIAELFRKNLEKFDPEEFIQSAPEGYLFPDTYFISPNATAAQVIDMMQKNFNEKTKELRAESDLLGLNFADIVTMASIIEKETHTTESRKIVSGILWKRIELGMPLQVDVTFQYINGKNSFQLTENDLDIDSPYNTYNRTGLPPTPIANPGLDSIHAAIYPEKTSYLYFLSSRSGKMYYAKDFEEHKKNRRLYLDV